MGDLYGVLGVPRTASVGEVKHAFRQLARRYHPDRSDGEDAARRFEEVHAAYEVLSDPAARRAYDRTLPSVAVATRARLDVAPAPPPPRFEPPRREQPTHRWLLARALDAYRAEPRPRALAVDVIAW